MTGVWSPGVSLPWTALGVSLRDLIKESPNGLGTREAAIVTYCFTIMAVPQDLALSAVLLDRVLVTLVVVVVAQFATYRLTKPGSSKPPREAA